MKKMEFMRNAAAVIEDFFKELYVKVDYTTQEISLKLQQGTFTLKDNGSTIKFFVYKTGEISYNTRVPFGKSTDFGVYYQYNADDNHEEVLKKLAKDLGCLKPYLPIMFTIASFGGDPFKQVTFEYGKAFSSNIALDEDEEED